MPIGSRQSLFAQWGDINRARNDMLRDNGLIAGRPEKDFYTLENIQSVDRQPTKCAMIPMYNQYIRIIMMQKMRVSVRVNVTLVVFAIENEVVEKANNIQFIMKALFKYARDQCMSVMLCIRSYMALT